MTRHSRSDKLQTLMRLLGHREELARRALAERQRAMAGAQSQADELAGLQREYRDRLGTTSSAGVPAGELQLWRRFSQSLDDVVQVQSSQVERLRQELEQAQTACQEALIRRRGGERLEQSRQRRDGERERRTERIAGSDQATRRDRG